MCDGIEKNVEEGTLTGFCFCSRCEVSLLINSIEDWKIQRGDMTFVVVEERKGWRHEMRQGLLVASQ
jgi:hypothetical protein